MLKTSAKLGLFLVAALVVAGVMAQDATRTVTGTIKSVDAQNRTLVLEGERKGGAAREFKVSAEASMTKRGQPVTLRGLRRGDRVTLTVRDTSTATIPTIVAVRAPEPAAPATPSAPVAQAPPAPPAAPPRVEAPAPAMPAVLPKTGSPVPLLGLLGGALLGLAGGLRIRRAWRG